MNKRRLAENIKELIELEGQKPTEINVNLTTKRTPLPPNVMVFQTFAYLSATRLMPVSCKILMLFFSKMEYSNYIGMDISTIAKEIGMSQSSIEKGMRELKEENILILLKNPMDKRRNDYFLNPFSAWKGNGYERKKSIKKINNTEPNQLNLFGVQSDDSMARENKEIKDKQASLSDGKSI